MMKCILKQFALSALLLSVAIVCLASCDALGNFLPSETEPTATTAPTTTAAPVSWSLVLTADKTEPSRGDTITLSAVLRAAGQQDMPSVDTRYIILEGAEHVTRTGNKSNTMTVRHTAPHGATIKVMVMEGATESEEITLTVNVPAESVVASAGGATYLLPGEERTLGYTVSPSGACSDVVFAATVGADAVDIVGGKLVVKAGTPFGTVIKVKATVGTVSSDELSFIVGYPLEGISISAKDALLNILPGDETEVIVVKDPTNAVGTEYTLEFVNDCAGYASISGNVITVSDAALTGAKIRVKAVAGDFESNVIEYTVGYPLESITVSAAGPLGVLPGDTITVNVTKDPVNATDAEYRLQFANTCTGYARIDGNVITVLDTALYGAEIKVFAVAGGVESNVLTYTVGRSLESLTVSAEDSLLNILPGKTAQVKVTLDPEDALDGEYTLVFVNDCAGYAGISGNVITVSDTALTGAKICVKAVKGDVESNIIEYTVGYPLESLTIAAKGPANLFAGDTAEVIVVKDPANATNGEHRLVFVNDCAGYASIEGNVITVLGTAKVGDEIKVKAVAGDVESNTIVYTVGYPLRSLTLFAGGPLNVLAGKTATMEVVLNPQHATNGEYTLVFVNDCAGYARISGNVITVSDTAPTGTKIRVKAVAGDIESNIIEYTVGYPLESIDAKLVGSSNINPGSSATLSATIYPANATNGDYEWEITEGLLYADLSDGQIKIKSDAPLGATVKVRAVAGAIASGEIVITVGTPINTLCISSSAPAILDRGGNYPLTLVSDPENASLNAVGWVITEGSEYASVVNNVLLIAANTPAGTSVKLHAAGGTVISNELSYTVGVKLDSITLSLDGVESIDPGASANISATLDPQNATDRQIAWVIEAGATYAEIADGVITVKPGAPVGTKITFHAEIGEVTSNSLTVTVGVPPTKIEISLGGVESIEPGESAEVLTTLTPANASDVPLSWVIDNLTYATYAEIADGVITVKPGAPIGTKITFHAEFGGVVSNSLTVTVGVPPTKIEISLDGVANIEPGESAEILTTLTPTDTSDVTLSWVIDTNKAYAEIVDGVITVKPGAPIGSQIAFHAEFGGVVSNSLSVTVGMLPTKIEISLGGVESIEPGASANLTADLEPSNVSSVTLFWVIDTNKAYASIVDGEIIVKPGTPIGTKITFHAEFGEVKSNSLTVTVGVPVTGVTISAPSLDKLEIVKGNTVELAATLAPANASVVSITWQITAGEGYATVSKNGVLTVSATAPTGAKIKVKAVAGGIESDDLEFTVLATQEEENATRYFIGLTSSNVTVDDKGMNDPLVVGTVTNANFDNVTDVAIQYTVTEGSQYLRIIQEGNNCRFDAIGHGRAIVTATIPGTNTDPVTVTVNVIVPPVAIDLPEVFRERTDIDYAFSKVNPDTGEAEALPFLPTPRGTGLFCTQYEVTFSHASGATGGEVAVYDYEKGAITFKKTGKVTVVVSSKSGSYVEASAVYTFDINEGYNVYTFAELQQRIEMDTYNGQIVNMVVLEKPVAKYATSYPYGYDMVPPSALYDLDAKYADHGADAAAFIVNEILNGSKEDGTIKNRVQAINKSVWINGNSHKIDASQLRVFTREEYRKYIEKYDKVEGAAYIGELFSALPWEEWEPENSQGNPTGNAHNVRFYNIEVVGNCPVNFAGEKEGDKVFGCFTNGIYIGASVETTTDYYVECDNLTASGFRFGVVVSNVVGDSKLSNIKAYNCYASGLLVEASTVTLENMTFGTLGACAIDIGSGRCDKAGINEDENNRITFTGTIDVSNNLSDGDTEYFRHYTVLGKSVPTIIQYNLYQAMNENQRAHIMQNGQYNFISLLVADTSTFAPNKSQVLYPAYQSGGIIDVSELTDTVDTTHQYITMDIKADLTGIVPGMGVETIGKAIFYNMNYGK